MKKIYVLFSILFFSIQLFSQEVSAVLVAPANASPSQEFEISITVNKADVTGFARLQVDLPAGFNVKASQNQGSTFSFKDNKIRFLWMSLPADKELKVSCLATADNTVSGNISLSGSFSYVLKNETQRFTIPAQTIAFGGNAVASSNEDAKKETERLEKERQDKLAKDKAEHDRLAQEQAEKDAKEESDRIAQQYAQTQAANENTNNEKAVTPEVKTTTQDLTPKTDVITPEVKTTNQDLNPKTDVITVPENKTNTQTENTEQVKTNTYTTNTNSPKTNTNKPKSSTSSTATSSSNGAVEYKIQIGAYKTSPANGYYKKLEKNISEFQIKTSKDPDGFIRYFIGSFDNFASVDNFHKRVLQLGYTSFIVANKDGQKITIKQAKEISKN